MSYEVEITFPTGSGTNKAGLIFAHDGSNSYHAVVLDRNAGKLALHKITSGDWGGALDSVSVTINDSTAYTVKVERRQQHVEASLVGQGGFGYDSFTDFGSGLSGLYADKTNVTPVRPSGVTLSSFTTSRSVRSGEVIPRRPVAATKEPLIPSDSKNGVLA